MSLRNGLQRLRRQAAVLESVWGDRGSAMPIATPGSTDGGIQLGDKMGFSKRVQSIRRLAKREAQSLLTRTDYGRRRLLPHYRYMFSPEQLWALCQAAESVLPLGGAFAEIGVYAGDTTLYLHRHLREKGDAPTYYCIDTFSGFTDEDIQVERERGKTDDFTEVFGYNSKEMFERTMQVNGLNRAVSRAVGCSYV